MQTNLFPPVLKSVSYSDTEILNTIIALYSPAGFDLDCTYSTGEFYKYGVPQPRIKTDKYPQSENVQYADSTALPFKDKEFSSVMFDPVFMASWHVESKAYKMTERFGTIKGITQLHDYYEKSIEEISRVLKGGGIAVVKCQDLNYGRRQYFNHIYIYEMAMRNKFKPLDIFIKIAKNRITNTKGYSV